MPAGLGAPSASTFERVRLASNLEAAAGLAGAGTLGVWGGLVGLIGGCIVMDGCGGLSMLAGALGVVEIGVGLGGPRVRMLRRLVLRSGMLLIGMLLWRGKPDWIQWIVGGG